jgi:CubicO group peptidase (beta-lactamase class C family)
MLIINEYENQLKKDIKDDNINGSISAAIVKHNKVIWSQAFGPLDRNGDRFANDDTIYRAASITKSFTAFLMMQFVQDGILELDDPVEKHFPEIRELEGYSESRRITFRQLASHTSGLIREPKLENADSGPIEEWEYKVLQSIPKTLFESNPGERFSYSNIGYGILGVALSRTAQQPLIEMIEERIFKPLHMSNSFFVVPKHKLENLAQGMGGGPFGDRELDLEGPKNEHRGRGYKVPNGGLYSTPTDLGKFLISNMGYTNILEKKYLESMHTRQTPEASYHGYGLGFEIYQDPSMTIAGHSGGMWGYSSCFAFEKQCQYGVILLRNYNWGTTSWDIGPKVLLRKLVDSEKSEYHNGS